MASQSSYNNGLFSSVFSSAVKISLHATTNQTAGIIAKKKQSAVATPAGFAATAAEQEEKPSWVKVTNTKSVKSAHITSATHTQQQQHTAVLLTHPESGHKTLVVVSKKTAATKLAKNMYHTLNTSKPVGPRKNNKAYQKNQRRNAQRRAQKSAEEQKKLQQQQQERQDESVSCTAATEISEAADDVSIVQSVVKQKMSSLGNFPMPF
eukprot:scaffold5510_cov76-Amphora_coffeaeformis.AAC.2